MAVIKLEEVDKIPFDINTYYSIYVSYLSQIVRVVSSIHFLAKTIISCISLCITLTYQLIDDVNSSQLGEAQ